jgi:hypothetical protein
MKNHTLSGILKKSVADLATTSQKTRYQIKFLQKNAP